MWTSPANENTSYPKGVSVKYVPDMFYNPITHETVSAATLGATNDPGPGSMTFYYTNQQSARLMFYHDHAYGLTRLNVYAGVAAAYLETDSVEQALINGGTVNGVTFTKGTLPDVGIPLVIQDKTFLPNAAQLATEDNTWPFVLNASRSDLWWPHVYMPNQNQTGAPNPMGRWDYSPWAGGPMPMHGPVPNPLYPGTPGEPSLNPGTPNPSIVPEAFADVLMVNGNVYPYLQVGQNVTRFRILNAATDRTFNLQLYYASTAGPFIRITGGAGTGASAKATVDKTTGAITGISVTSTGAGYTSVPTVTIFDAPGHTGGSGAIATVDGLDANGGITTISVTSAGSGYSIPTICKGPGAPSRNLCTEISMIPADPTNPAFPAEWRGQSGGAYTILDPVNRSEGIPDPDARGPQFVQIGTEGGFLPATVDILNRPIGIDYASPMQGVYNIKEKALQLAGAERADVLVDFTQVPDGSTLILYTDSPIPVTGGDPRYDYFTDAPDNTLTGGATSTIPGYGPNTRTVMQIQVLASKGTNPALNRATLNSSIKAAYNVSQDKPIVAESAYNGPFNAGYSDQYVNFPDTSFTFNTGAGNLATLSLKPKSINDMFDPMYGGLMTVLGVYNSTGTPIALNNFDPPTEIINNSNAAVQIGTLADGTQIWRVMSKSVDTHPMHWHMFNVQVINRISQIPPYLVTPPDPSELGWRETLRMNPLEDTIVALRPIKPSVPWDLPNNIRPLDSTAPLGTTSQFFTLDPNGLPVSVSNHLVNFGEEYVWHCHILGHEESMIMRPISIVVTPRAPILLTVLPDRFGRNATLVWRDNSTDETNWTIQRSTTGAVGTFATIAIVPSTTGPRKDILALGIYTDKTNTATRNYYRVLATNVVGDTTVYTGGASYPTVTADSVPSNVVRRTP
jgi:FtsP/CotA-like multicopper oxidase with cupredoxin domain